MSAWGWSARTTLVTVARSQAETLAEIHAVAFAHTWSAEDFAALLADRGVFAVGLSRQGIFSGPRLVGFVLVRVAADEAEILTIAVRPVYRRRGYGRLLMDEALRRLHRAGASRCFLEVDRGNAPAVALYHSLGFQVAGERRNYYQSDSPADGTALVMRVQLR